MKTLLVLLRCVALVAVGVSCSSSGPSSDSASDVVDGTPIGTTDLPPLAQTVAEDLQILMSDLVPTWDGFDPSNHPSVVLVVDDDGSATTGFSVNYPSPSSIGQARTVAGVDGLSYLSEFEEEIEIPVNGFFDWGIDVGGVDTYVVTAQEFHPLASAGSDAWRGLFIHEMFHQHQEASWENTRFVDQNENLYQFDQENIELALLEDAVLVAAIESDSSDDVTKSLQQFIAIRDRRLADFPSTQLDEAQEAVEGTAHWFEWHTLGRDRPVYTDPVVDVFLDDPTTIIDADVRPHVAFGRFYVTGGAIMELLDRQGIAWHEAIENGTWPAEVLRESLEVEPTEYEALIAEAQETHDADGQLSELAGQWSEVAQAGGSSTEPSDGDFTESEGTEVTPEMLECLESFGVVISETEVEIPEEAVEACF